MYIGHYGKEVVLEEKAHVAKRCLIPTPKKRKMGILKAKVIQL
jgi:hypothetical protein